MVDDGLILIELDEIIEAKEVLRETKELFSKAEDVAFSGDEEKALSYYYAVTTRAPDSLYGRLAAGQIAVISGSVETALKEFLIAAQIEGQLLKTRLVKESEDRVKIHLGLTYRKIGNFDEAIEAFESINPLERKLKNAFAYAGLASVYRAMSSDVDQDDAGRERALAKATEFALWALDEDPNLNYAKTVLVKLYEIEGRSNPPKMEQAFQLAKEVLAEEPDNWYLHGLIGNMLAKNNPTEAADHFRQAIQIAPKREIYAKIGLAMLLKTSEGEESFEAKGLFEEVIEVQPTNVTAISNLADILYREGSYPAAQVKAEQALELIDEHPPERQIYARTILARIELAQGHVNAAEKVLDPIRKIRDNKIGNLLGRIDKARQKAPELIELAKTSENNGQKLEAVRYGLEAIELQPRNFKLYRNVSRILLELGDWQRTIEVSVMALKAGESFGYSEANVAEAYLGLGQDENALRVFRAALEKADDIPDRRASSDFKSWIWSQIKNLERKINREVKTRKLSIGRQEVLPAGGPYLEFQNTLTQEVEVHSTELIKEFLPYVIGNHNLPIGQKIPGTNNAPIDLIGKEPVFLVAKTGVGKTVTVPTKVLISHFDSYFVKNGTRRDERLTEFPQVYVVVPRIPIAEGQMNFMNSVYQGYLAERKVGNPGSCNLFGSISSLGKKNANAPILFITTGIFESMTFNGQLNPALHRIIIDEAHVTIEQNPGVEISIAIAAASGVRIDYMSATVKTDTLRDDLGTNIVVADNIRYPILLKNLGGPVEDHLLELVRNYLVEPKIELYPDRNDPVFGRVTVDLYDHRNRPRGMLVVVNSHQGAHSDTRKYCKLVEEADFNQGRQLVSVFSYAAPIARDQLAEEHFRQQIAMVEAKNGLYVIVATNVVEMGVTFDSLDYIVTMDSEFVTKFIDGGQLLETTALGVNALYQRIGRVGRKRGGMAFIAKEFGAPFTELSDAELRKGLDCQEIVFPIAKGNLQKLALYSYKEAWQNPEEQIERLRLPSLRRSRDHVIQNFTKERKKLEQLGLTKGEALNDIGQRGLEFLSVECLDYKRLLALAEKTGQHDLIKVVLVAAATADIGLSRFLISGTKFTGSDDSGVKDNLAINKYLLLAGTELDFGRVQQALASYQGELLIEKLTALGVSTEDIGLIVRHLQAGFRVGRVALESNDEEADTNEEQSAQERIGLFFEKTAALSDPDCEVITIYEIVAYFYNRFQKELKQPGLTEGERLQVVADLDERVSELGINPILLRGAIKNLEDLMRQFSANSSLRISGEPRRERLAPNFLLAAETKIDCLTICLIEQAESLKLAEVSARLFEELASELLESGQNLFQRDNTDSLKKIISAVFRKFDFKLEHFELNQILGSLVLPAWKKYSDVVSSLESQSNIDELPVMTERLRRQVIDFIKKNEFGDEVVLTFSAESPFYLTWVGQAESETGETLPVLLRTNQTCLQLRQEAGVTVKVRGRLVPSYFTEQESEAAVFARGGEQLASHLRSKERVFELLHLTAID